MKDGWRDRRLRPLTSFGGVRISYADVDINQGVVADGYISGATVFIDLNNNGEFDIESEPFAITDDNGNYQLSSIKSDAPILAFGGTDISTNTVFNATLSAPNGSSVINPLTTVIEKMVSSGKVENYEEANKKLVEAIGIETDDGDQIDLTQFDPLQVPANDNASEEEIEEAVTAAQAAIQIGTLLVATNEIGGNTNSIIDNIADEVIESVDEGLGIQLQESLATESVVENLISEATEEINVDVEEFSQSLAQTNAEITTAESVEEIVNEQTILFREVGVEVDETAAPIYGYVVSRQVDGTNTFEVKLSRPPLNEVLVNVSAKQSGLFEPSAGELYFNPDNWDQAQYITIYKSGGIPINSKVTTGITFEVNNDMSSEEFRNQPPLTVAFETNIDKSKPLKLNITQDNQYIILTWERGTLQSSSNLEKDTWNDVLLFNIDGQYATSPHRVRKNKGTILFRLKDTDN